MAVVSNPRSLFRELILTPLAEQRSRLVAIAGALLALATAQGLFLLMVRGFVKALFEGNRRAAIAVGELIPPPVVDWLPAHLRGLVSTQSLTLLVPAIIVLAGCAWALATYVFQLNQQAVSLYVAKRYRERLFAALLTLPYMEIRKRPVGEWMSVVMNDVMFLQMRLSDVMTGLVRDTVVIVAGLIVLAWLHWPTALVVFAIAPFIAYGLGRTGKRIAKYSEAFQKELGRIAAALLDFRARFDMIRAQGGEGRESQRFLAINRRYYQMIRRSILVRSAFAPTLEALGFVGFAVVVYAVGRGYWAEFSPELLLQFFVALGVLLKPLRELGEQLTRLAETRGVLAGSVATFKAIAGGMHDPTSPSARGVFSATTALKQPLVIETVTVAWRDEVRFHGENLHIEPGQSIAIIGPSGAGKSTLLKCLAGLVPPQSWQASTPWLETVALTAMVSQEPFLFDDSIGANLTYDLDATRAPDEAAIWDVLSLVNMADEVRSLAGGLTTRLRAIGSNISGGQLQRLVIARGLLRQQPILLLDEATSAIDVRSERDITTRLIALCKRERRALLAVTHRLSLLDHYDEVWFVEEGRRVYAGTHAALRSEPRYLDYCASEGGEYELS